MFDTMRASRKASEALDADLAGDDPYGKQAKLARFGILSFHQTKKSSPAAWVEALKSKGKHILQATNPENKKGPWTLLRDNEGFLDSKETKALYT